MYISNCIFFQEFFKIKLKQLFSYRKIFFFFYFEFQNVKFMTKLIIEA